MVSVDLASIGPLLAGGRRAAHALIAAIAPDLLFATAAEAEAFLGGRRLDRLLDVALTAVVKRGPRGATVLTRVGGEGIRFEVATEQLVVSDTTGAGDAFDAGLPGRLVRRPTCGAVVPGIAPSSGARRSSGGRATPLDATSGAGARLSPLRYARR